MLISIELGYPFFFFLIKYLPLSSYFGLKSSMKIVLISTVPVSLNCLFLLLFFLWFIYFWLLLRHSWFVFICVCSCFSNMGPASIVFTQAILYWKQMAVLLEKRQRKWSMVFILGSCFCNKLHSGRDTHRYTSSLRFYRRWSVKHYVCIYNLCKGFIVHKVFYF